MTSINEGVRYFLHRLHELERVRPNRVVYPEFRGTDRGWCSITDAARTEAGELAQTSRKEFLKQRV